MMGERMLKGSEDEERRCDGRKHDHRRQISRSFLDDRTGHSLTE